MIPKRLSQEIEAKHTTVKHICQSLQIYRLRKYIATILQIQSLKETKVDWLARQLGHDILVHMDFYGLSHDYTIEISKFSKLHLNRSRGNKQICSKNLDSKRNRSEWTYKRFFHAVLRKNF